MDIISSPRQAVFFKCNCPARRSSGAAIDAGPGVGTSVPSATLNSRRMVLRGPSGEFASGDGAATLLSALALAPGRRLEHWQLIEALHEDAETYTTEALAVRVVRLRQLLKLVGFEGATIRALRLEGYQLCVMVTVA